MYLMYIGIYSCFMAIRAKSGNDVLILAFVLYICLFEFEILQ